MPLVHAVVGSLLIATNAAAALWGFVAYRRDRAPGQAYRQLPLYTATATGHDGLLPLLAVAYPYALRGDDGRRNLLLFTVGSALVAALGVRAFMTGPS